MEYFNFRSKIQLDLPVAPPRISPVRSWFVAWPRQVPRPSWHEWLCGAVRKTVGRLIIENVDEKNPKDIHGRTPIDLAEKNGHKSVCQIFQEGMSFFQIFRSNLGCKFNNLRHYRYLYWVLIEHSYVLLWKHLNKSYWLLCIPKVFYWIPM